MAVHEEILTGLKFNEKIKNALRDYYSYGFKTLSDYGDKSARETARADWTRLNNILTDDNDYLKWQKDTSYVLFVTADSQAMPENPFQKVYRFCDNKQTDFFLSAIAELSAAFQPAFLSKDLLYRLIGKSKLPKRIREELQDDIKNEYIKTQNDFISLINEKMQELGSSLTDNLMREFNQLRQAAKYQISPNGLKASELFAELNIDDDSFRRSVNDRMNALVSLGIIRCMQNGNSGSKYYCLSRLTFKGLLKAGTEADPNFATHLYTALDFYSRYYPFGETGLFLTDRMGPGYASGYVSPFHFKHEYFMQALNDFNLIDLLSVIEEGEFCGIVWKRRNRSSETLAFPLEIRVSSTTGRETLIYYDILERSLEAIRLEFIDDIFTYKEDAIKRFITGPHIGLSPEEIKKDISRARERLKDLWGTALTLGREQNLLKDPATTTVRLTLSIDPRTQDYIRTRLLRECRTGKVTVSEDGRTLYFEAEVFDTRDIRTWIRTFYSHIISCAGMDREDFSITDDVEKMKASIAQFFPPNSDYNPHGGRRHADKASSVTQTIRDTSRTDICSFIRSGDKVRAHEQIFNEIFSVYTAVSADTFVLLANGEESNVKFEDGLTDSVTFTDEDLDNAINRSLKRYSRITGSKTEDFLGGKSGGCRDCILSEYLSARNNQTSARTNIHTVRSSEYRLNYYCEKDVDFYRDVLPLTIFERRWLKTILSDEKIRYFLTGKEISAMNEFLESGEDAVNLLPMDKIVSFDRFNTSREAGPKDHENMGILLDGIYNNKMVSVCYRTNNGKLKRGRFIPVQIEYSKRNDRFQAYLISENNKRVYTMNLSQIEDISLTEAKFDKYDADDIMNSYHLNNRKSVVVTFYDTRDITDRILTEFSPWEKSCSYDRETGLYSLTIYYQKQDEAELVIRLMGYGPYIHFKDPDHTICRKIQQRLDEQISLFNMNSEKTVNAD